MKKRDASSAPTVGDRVAYVVVKGAKGSKTYEKSEDPVYVLEHNIPIDFSYYIENQIKLPLVRIFEPIFSDSKKTELELFSGEHTRTIYQPKVSSNMGGLGKFAVVKETCMGCKNVLEKGWNDVVCQKCMPKKKQIFIERNLELG
jgi:DNA polymerase delta subunit 1